VQRKREREKARHATMIQEERDEKNKKRREKYHLRKAETALAAWSFVATAAGLGTSTLSSIYR